MLSTEVSLVFPVLTGEMVKDISVCLVLADNVGNIFLLVLDIEDFVSRLLVRLGQEVGIAGWGLR